MAGSGDWRPAAEDNDGEIYDAAPRARLSHGTMCVLLELMGKPKGGRETQRGERWTTDLGGNLLQPLLDDENLEQR